jgi:RND family efflux transporter MFP subunit
MKFKTLSIILGFSILLLLLSGCGQKPVSKEILKNVKVISIAKSDISITDEFAGEVVSDEQIQVAPKMPGKVSAVYVDVGSKVKKGELLFSLDASDNLAQVNIAQAGVEAANINLRRARGTAQDNYETALSNYEKMKILYQEGGISKSELDAVKDSIDAAKAQLEQSRASLSLSRTQLGETNVYAPAAGIIASRSINVGELASSAVPALTIVNNDKLYVSMNVSEKLINKISIGQKLQFIIDSITDKTFEGQITNISPAADAQTHFYEVKAKVLDSDERIKHGMFSKTKMVIENKERALTLPNQGVVTDNGLPFAYIVKDGAVEKKPIQVGLANDKITEITQGLSEGDQVILEGQNFLTDGEKVNVVK